MHGNSTSSVVSSACAGRFIRPLSGIRVLLRSGRASTAPLACAGLPAYISSVDEISSEGRLQLDRVFRALGDPTRREILRLLRARDLGAGEIAERFPLARSTLSGHFNVLKEAGLIVAERQGTVIRYSLSVSAFEEGLAAVMELLKAGASRKERSS